MAEVPRAKRTKHVAQKKAPGASSSSRTPSSVSSFSFPLNWFTSPLAKEMFEKFKPLSSLQFHFDFCLFFRGNLDIMRTWFDKLSLSDFVVNYNDTYDDMVRLFYANMSSKHPSLELTTSVGGVNISLTPALLAEILGIPNEGISITSESLDYDDFYAVICDNPSRRSLDKPSTSELSAQTRILFLYFSHFLSKQGSHTDYPRIQQNLVYCVKAGIQFNLPQLIIDTMHSRRQFRPFHMTLTRIFRYFDIPLFGSHSYSVDQCIDKAKLSARLGFKMTAEGDFVRSRGKPPVEEVEEAEEDLREYVDNRLAELQLDIDARFDALESRLTSRFDALESRMDSHFERLLAQFRSPPPT